MRRLRIESFGEDNVHQGIRLIGDKRNPEPVMVSIKFPGGEVTVTRCTDGAYWVHVDRNDPQAIANNPEAELTPSRLTDARLDIRSKHASESNLGDFEHPELYHLAVKIQPT